MAAPPAPERPFSVLLEGEFTNTNRQAAAVTQTLACG